MSPEAQRIAIAEASGYSKADHYELGFGGGMRLVTGWKRPNGIFERRLPDYLNDLNAMHEAEKVLRGYDLSRYFQNLCLTAGPEINSVLATASQRAEAFLRTIGKWVPYNAQQEGGK